jgi:AraC family transcriptional regulator
MNVEIKEMPALRVATVRHVGPYDRIPQAFERLSAIAGAAGLFGRPGVAMMGLFHNDPDTTPSEELLSDAALAVPEDLAIPSGLTEARVPAGWYACTLFVGPYEQLGEAWTKLKHEWLPASGKRGRAGISYERYLNTPGDVPKEQLRTELCIPVT